MRLTNIAKFRKMATASTETKAQQSGLHYISTQRYVTKPGK